MTPRLFALLPVLASSITTCAAFAQEAHVILDWDNGTGSLFARHLQLDGGAVLEKGTADLSALAGGSTLRPLGVEWVGDELWVASFDGIRRYSAPPYAYLGAALVDEPVLALVPLQGGGAVAFTPSGAAELDPVGTELIRTAVPAVWDAIPFQGGFLVIEASATLERLVLYDAQLQSLGVFAEDLRAATLSAGLDFEPRQLTLLRDGGVVAISDSSIGVVDAAGTVTGVFDTDQFEFECVETADGQLLVIALGGDTLVDRTSGGMLRSRRALGLGGSNAVTGSVRDLGGSVATRRLCATAPNSAGSGARLSLVGDADHGNQGLVVGLTGAPANAFTVLAYSPIPFVGPFGDGTLCLSPFAPGIIRAPAAPTDANGALAVAMDFESFGLGAAFIPGTTWYFQGIFRDVGGPGGTGVNASDSVALTFAF